MNLPAWLDSPAWLTLVPALGHTLWQGALITALLCLALRLVPASYAKARYALSASALLAVLVLGLGTWAWKSASSVSRAPSPASSLHLAPPTAEAPGQASPPPAASSPLAPTPASPWPHRLAVFWLLGVAAGLLRTTRGVIGAGRLRRACQPLRDPVLLALADEVRARFRVPARLRLMVCEHLTSPAVMGVLRPAILLPVSLLTGLPPEQIRAILAHEFAHLQRWDYLANLAQMLIEALLFFNPFVWWISRQVRLEREACCDQLAAAECASPSEYVHALLSVTRPPSMISAPLLAAAGSHPGQTLERTRRLLVPSYLPSLRLRWFSLLTVLTVAGITLFSFWEGTRAVAQAVAMPGGSSKAEEQTDFICLGRVVLPDGTPASFDSGRVFLYAPTGNGTLIAQSRVESNGLVAIHIPTHCDSATVAVVADGYATKFLGPFKPPFTGQLESLEIKLQPGFTGSVQAVDEAGQPIARALLKSSYPGPPEIPAMEAATDATGTARLEHVGTAPLRIRISAAGYQSDEIAPAELDAKPARVILHPAKPLVGFVVAKASGAPIPSAKIKLAGVRGPHEETYSDPEKAPILAEADSNGRFELTTLRADSQYYLFVEAVGYSGALVANITSATTNLRPALEPPLYVTGRVINAPPADVHEGKFNLGYTQYFFIGEKSAFGTGQSVWLEPKDGEAEFRVGPLYRNAVDLQARDTSLKINADELPKSGVVLDMSAKTGAQ